MGHNSRRWYKRHPLMRTERSGQMNDGEDAQIISIQGSKFEDQSTGEPATGIGGEDYAFANPVIIYKYKIEVATNFMGFVYQTIGSSTDSTALSNYNTTDRKFKNGLKNVKMLYGETGSIQKVTMSFHSKRGIPIGAVDASGWDWFNISVFCDHTGATNRDYLARLSLWYKEIR